MSSARATKLVTVLAVCAMLLLGCGVNPDQSNAQPPEQLTVEEFSKSLAPRTTASVLPLDEAKAAPLELLQPGRLRVAATDGMAPNSFTRPDGTFTGFDNELLLEIAQKLDLEVTFEAYRFNGLIPALRGGSVDMTSAPISPTEARMKLVNFSNGYNFGSIAVIVRNDSPVQSAADITADTPVAAVQGSLQYDFAARVLGLDPVGFVNISEALLSLQRGNVDVLLAPTFLKGVAEASGELRLAFELTQVKATSAYAMSYNNPHLMDAINAALDACVADGTWSRLNAKWFPDRPVPADWNPGSMTAVPLSEASQP